MDASAESMSQYFPVDPDGAIGGQTLSLAGVPETLVAVGSKMSKNGIFVKFSRPVNYGLHDSKAIIAPQQKKLIKHKENGHLVKEAMRLRRCA